MSDSSLSTELATAFATALANALQYHMRQVTSTLPDSRDTVREWTTTLHEAIGDANANCLAFLGNGITSHHELFMRLQSHTLNPHASWFVEHLQSLPTPDSYECGAAIDTMRTNIQSVLSMYRATLVKTVEADNDLCNAITGLETAIECMLQSQTNEYAQQTHIHDNIQTMYESAEIEEKYRTFCKLYSICMALRTLIHPLHEITRSGALVCNLCLQTPSVPVAFVPCGHIVCSSCMHTRICYICHCNVEQHLHLQI